MSFFDCPNAQNLTPADCPASVDQVIVPRTRDIGGFEVRRVLPSSERRTIGPFVFFDQMGLGHFKPGHGLDVRPHPHIGLATITYLFSGEIMHRDSLNTRQVIRPGAVNLMTAGRGIVHSERSPDDARARDSELFGLQAWIALPKRLEEIEPDFSHHPASDLPLIEDGGVRARVLAGTAYGQVAPVPVRSETLYVDIELGPGARVPIDSPHEERGLYIADGSAEVDGQRYEAGQLLVLKSGVHFTLGSERGARLALLGGEPLDGPRHLWWNFVHSDKARIEQAKADWVAGRFDKVIDDPEWIPLPDR
ncbi:MAG: pirin family protein [Wenzhouxiangella sp.]|nr:pirin family protein [Wenzhouxiangella sp.]